MANPPIDIGPFLNVPAPGSAVKSDWPQQITNYVTPTLWTTMALVGSWGNFGGTCQVAQYRKIGDRVFLRGCIKGGAIGTAFFTMPAGFRPPGSVGDLAFAVVSNQLFGVLSVISTSGALIPSAGSNGSFFINCDYST